MSVQRVTARAGVPVIVGVSAAGLAPMAALSNKAMDAGAAGVMVAPPHTLNTDAQIVGYYHDVAEKPSEKPLSSFRTSRS